jgi:hypothetical protein
MGDGDGPNIGLPRAAHMHEHGDIGVGGRHAVQQGRSSGIAGGLRQAGGGHQLPEQDGAAGCRHRGVQRLQLLQHRAQVQQALFQHLQTFLKLMAFKQCCGSGIPGFGMGKKSGSGSGINNPDHISECLETIF